MQAHIVRIDQNHTHAWQVRLNLNPEATDRYESKSFSDSLHGGKRKARKAAEEYLRYRVEEYGHVPLPLGRHRGMMFPENPTRTLSTNTSGRTGVYHGQLRRPTKSGVTVQSFWAAHYNIGADGKPTHSAKRFYYGRVRSSEEAKQLAIEFREGWEAAFLEGKSSAIRRFFREWSRRQ